MRFHWIALRLTLALAASLCVMSVFGQAPSEQSSKVMEYLRKGSVHYFQNDFKFYYNLACTYAEMNDLDNTIVYLKRAFEYKDNQNPGGHMPDPKKDDSFRRFLKDKRFQETLREMNAS